MSRQTETVNVVNQSNLNTGGRTVFNRDFPLGEGWFKMMLRIKIGVVIGTGSGAITDSFQHIVSNILLRTDAGETLVNLPARALQKIAHMRNGYAPNVDTIAAASADYYIDIPIMFTDDSLIRPNDTILDTGRYNSVTLDITMGTVADLFSTVGSATITAAIDIEIERTKTVLPDEAMPVMVISQEFVPPIDAANQTYVDLERSTDLSYKRIFAHACADGSTGSPLSGTNADDVQNLESLQDQAGFIVQERVHEMIQNQNKNDYALASSLAGITIFDFVTDGSINSTVWSGDKSKLQYRFTNKAGVAANDLITIFYDGIRTLK